jgi:5-methylcytosine-specific restriction endonuclease McrA
MTAKELNTAEWKRLRVAILERDAFTCGYCGNEATAVDHIHPRALGGTNDPGNLIASCIQCNSRKKDRIMIRQPWTSPRWGVTL